MSLNTCCTAQTFSDPAWNESFREFHRNLIKCSFDQDRLRPSMFDWYWNTLWKDAPEKIFMEFCNPQNVRQTHKIWEYVQIVHSLRMTMQELKGKRILSLGAGIESPLWALARMGAGVVATDIYFERRYWHKEQVGHIRSNPSVFCPYADCKPVQFKNINLKFRTPWGRMAFGRLGTFDAIYSISSLEHIHGAHRVASCGSNRPILKKKIAMFSRILPRLRSGGIFTFTTEIITGHAGKRRLDFYTREELESITESLSTKGLHLAGAIDWTTLTEQDIPTNGVAGQRHTAISLAFRKT
jgi:hypothetical protein